MTPLFRAALLFALAASFARSPFARLPLEQGARPKIGLGVLRRDGVMIPFASYDGRAWTADWPGPNPDQLPITIADIPKRWWGALGPAAPWTAWPIEGSSRPLKLETPSQVSVFCVTRFGLKTDYPPGAYNPREPTIPKDAWAIAGTAVTPTPIVSVSVLSQDAKKIVEAIREDFNREEALAVNHFTNWFHPFGPRQREAYPIELEAYYRTREGDWTTSYIEAVRKFPALPEDHGCGLITFVRGWVTERTGAKPVIDVGARVTFCDRADVSFMLPFGRLQLGTDFFWVYQLSSWRDEIYTVARVRSDGVKPVLAALGGGCPKDAPPAPRTKRGGGG